MSDLSQSQTASLVLNPGDVYRISTGGTATVKVIYGAPSGTTTITANFATFGPYDAPAKLDVTAVSGTASYSLLAAIPVTKVDGKFSDPALQSLVSGGGKVVPLNAAQTPEGVRAAIQAALDGGSAEVHVNGPGTFVCGGPLILDDFTDFYIDEGCRLKWPSSNQPVNAQRGMIENRAKTATKYAVTVTASGRTATIAWTAHGKAVGDAIMLEGSSTRGYNGAYRVASVVNANSLTVQLDAQPEANTAAVQTYFASVVASTANQGIRVFINGTLDGNGTNNPVVNDYPVMGVILSRVLNCWIMGSGSVLDPQGYAMTIAGGSHCGWDCSDLYINNPRRDGAHFQGPIRHGVIRGLRGYTYDDFTSLTTGDYALYNEMTEGEFEDILIENIYAENPSTGSACAQFGKSRHPFGDVRYRNVRGKQASALVTLKRLASGDQYSLDKVVYRGTLTIEDCAVENLDGAINYVSLLLCTGDPTLKTVVLDGVELQGTNATNFCRLYSFSRVAGDWSIDTLVIKNFKSYNQGAQFYSYGEAGITINSLQILDSSPWIADYKSAFGPGSMTINQVLLRNVRGDYGDGATLFDLGAGTVGRVTIDSCEPIRYRTAGTQYLVYSNGASVKAIDVLNTGFAGAAVVWGDTSMNVTQGHRLRLRGVTLESGTKAAILNKAVTILTDQQVELGTGTVYDLRGSAQVYSVQEGTIDSARTAPFAFTGGATVNLYAPQRRVAVDTAGVARVEGGALWNTNAAAGTLATAGPVVCLGTAANSWKRVGNYALTY